MSEFRLACAAIACAATDAGIELRDIDGFASFGDERNDPLRLSAALGCEALSFSNMFWGGGGGGCAGVIGNAAAALSAGMAHYVVAYRAIAQGEFPRFGTPAIELQTQGTAAFNAPYGLLSRAQFIALRTRSFMEHHRISANPMAAIALTSYHHAQQNPAAVMFGRPLTRQIYDQSRWIVEPFRLFDCCQESDGAVAVILTTKERARDLRQKPCFVLGTAQGSQPRYRLDVPGSCGVADANLHTIASRLFSSAGIRPSDVDVAQIYENFTGATMMSLVELGFCDPEGLETFCTPENLCAPNGLLPINTSGGNLAACYIHGFELIAEGVRQIRGTSTNQVPSAAISLVAGGPATAPVSGVIFGA